MGKNFRNSNTIPYFGKLGGRFGDELDEELGIPHAIKKIYLFHTLFS
jgi:hypothetical protein